MNKTFRSARFVLMLCTAAFAVYFPVYAFSFWKDDWHFLWEYTYLAHRGIPIWLHSGTLAEFFVFTRAFFLFAPAWHTVGILLKIGASLAILSMTATLLRSSLSGKIAAVLYLVSYAAAESVGWVSGHIVNLDTILVCLSVTCAVLYRDTGRKRWLGVFLFLFVVALAADTARTFPIMLLVPLAVFLFRPARINICRGVAAGLFILVPAGMGVFLAALQNRGVAGIQAFRFLQSNAGHPGTVIAKLGYIGTFFLSLFEIAFGWISPVTHELPETAHAVYSHPTGLFAAALYALLLMFGIARRSRRSGAVILFALSWMTLFYVPNWLYEPRLTITPVHRYAAVSLAGAVFAAGYFLSVMDRTLSVVLLAVLLAGNYLRTSSYFREVGAYRNRHIVDQIWDEVGRSVNLTRTGYVVFTGEEPVKTNIFSTTVNLFPMLLRTRTAILPDVSVSDSQESAQREHCSRNPSSGTAVLYTVWVSNSGEVKTVRGIVSCGTVW